LSGRLPGGGTLRARQAGAGPDPHPAAQRHHAPVHEAVRVRERQAALHRRRLDAIAESALDRKIGARGLRMIIEELMLDLMYQVAEPEEGPRSHITREVVLEKDKPITLIEKAVNLESRWKYETLRSSRSATSRLPAMMMPFVIGRPSSTRALDHALLKDKRFSSRRARRVGGRPAPEDIFTMGCVANVVQS